MMKYLSTLYQMRLPWIYKKLLKLRDGSCIQKDILWLVHVNASLAIDVVN